MSKINESLEQQFDIFLRSRKIYTEKTIPLKKREISFEYYTHFTEEKDEYGYPKEDNGYIYYKPLLANYAWVIMFKCGKYGNGKRVKAEFRMVCRMLGWLKMVIPIVLIVGGIIFFR